MDSKDQLICKQRESFNNEEWADGDLLPYVNRRDNTFGQYVANIDLIALEPFVQSLKGDSAVTVCDGRAVEASYLKQSGLNVMATDLSPDYLAKAAEKGEIERFSGQNAEGLSFSDNEFDWGFVKAGLHHLPRPGIGIYELIRVAQKGIFILEGQDSFLLGLIRRYALTGRDWETSGNYVYRFKEWEIEKICLGLDLPGYVIKKTFMPWHRSLEKIKKGTFMYKFTLMFFKFINTIFSSQGNNFSVIIFKNLPNESQIKKLKQQGFKWVKLPRNPYLNT